MNSPLQTGLHLFTKDGRIVGNAIVTWASDDGQTARVETDFGNGGNVFQLTEIEAWWHLTDNDGLAKISDVAQWRADRWIAVAAQCMDCGVGPDSYFHQKHQKRQALIEAGKCPDCQGTGEIGGQFCGGQIVSCQICHGTGTINHVGSQIPSVP